MKTLVIVALLLPLPALAGDGITPADIAALRRGMAYAEATWKLEERTLSPADVAQLKTLAELYGGPVELPPPGEAPLPPGYTRPPLCRIIRVGTQDIAVPVRYLRRDVLPPPPAPLD